ncbi:DUF3078 domain-containing protein [Soonwooa sp.]|uniref:DUF3078 domain-containing protein n=1 Tax=Soonwooa sp. TaxID=1938592 RepID=UPI00289F1EFC|nr:DUF3078 domain-containing protein [Soonwooa sp.]
MKKLFSVVFVGLNLILFSQKRPDLSKIIDSIAQANWTTANTVLDSIDTETLSNIKVIKKGDTIIFKDRPQLSLQDMPITPYSMFNTVEAQRWFIFGQNSLVFNQSSFSNWYAGGNDNIGVIGKVNYNFNYKTGKHFLENNVQLGYGFVTSTGQSTRKTEDYINLSSNYGYELGSNYYISTGFQFASQFGAGYNYSLTPDPTYDDRVSKFMAPGYLNLGLGISYNPNDNFQLVMRSINGKFTFVLDPHLQQAGKFGLERDGQSMRTELGAMVNATYRINIMKDMTLLNKLNLFSNYLEHFERVDVAYSAALNMKFNRFITTVVTFDMVYDHDQIAGLQTKQTLGVGLTYNFGFKLERDKNSKIINPFIK